MLPIDPTMLLEQDHLFDFDSAVVVVAGDCLWTSLENLFRSEIWKMFEPDRNLFFGLGTETDNSVVPV